jgi:phenylacetate-CoA ligase
MSLLDVARGAYVRSPDIVRKSLAPLVALVPTRAKFGGTFREWQQNIALADVNLHYAAQAHIAALRGLMQKAHANSPYYRLMLDTALGAGFDYATFGPEHLQMLPVLSKSNLIAAGDAALATERRYLDNADTSGSNGERPFRFYLDKDRSAREMAFVYHGWGKIGFAPGMSKIVLRGFGLPPNGLATMEWEPALRELRLSVFPMTPADVVEYVRLIDQREIDYLYGYPSAIELMCRHMAALGIRPKRQLKAILPISEPVYPHQRGLFADVLGPVPVQGFYGLSEKAAFAIERAHEPDVYDFNPLYGATELVDWDGSPITEIGKQGRIIATGFLSTGMPFIRYDTEDLAELVEAPTLENGYRLSLRNIVPRRKPNFLVAADGNRVVTIDFTPDNPRYFEGLDEYQFYQAEPGKVTIRYIPTADGTLDQAQRVADGLTRRTHGRIVFTLEKVAQLAGGRAGKRAFIDQRLDLSRY